MVGSAHQLLDGTRGVNLASVWWILQLDDSMPPPTSAQCGRILVCAKAGCNANGFLVTSSCSWYREMDV